MNHRESMDESPDDNKKGFQYVDLKRNAVRGPDSQRGEMSASYQNPVRKASWSRSPTRPLRSNFEQLFTTTDGWKTDNRDTFKELLPMEMRRGAARGIEPRGMVHRRVTVDSSGVSNNMSWNRTSTMTRGVGDWRQPDLNPFGSVQEAAWKEQVDLWFQEADTNHDGRIEGGEAVAFFRRTGLPSEALSQMWKYTVPFGEHYMNKIQFTNALKLVSVLQSHSQLTPDIATQAFLNVIPNPAPRIQSLETPRVLVDDSSLQNDDDDPDDDDDSSADSVAQRAFSLPAAQRTGDTDWMDSEHDAISLRSGLRTQDISLDESISGDLFDFYTPDEVPAKATLVSVPIRLAPLYSKESANLRKLIGVNHSLIAAPSLKGGLLQYFRIQDNPGGTFDGRIKKLETEDVDSAFCSEIPPSQYPSSGKVTSMLAQETSNYLFLGFDDSHIEMHHVGKEPILLGKCVNQWKAHKHGSIEALAMTMWGDLWTGSSRGSVRLWREPSAGKFPNSTALKRPGGEKPHGGVKAIVVASCGSVVWTAGQNNISIWEAYSGSYLGRIETDRSFNHPVGVQGLAERNQRINTATGLDLDKFGCIAISQRFGIRMPSSIDESDLDNGGAGIKVAVGRLGRFFDKGRKRIGRNLNKNNPNAYPHAIAEVIILSPIQCMAEMLDRSIWVGYKKGQLEQFAFNGQFKNRTAYRQGLSCLCVVDDRMWVGLNDGRIAVLNIDFQQLKIWSAHEATIIDMTILGRFVYSLAADGSIKGWSRCIPNDAVDSLTWQRFMSCMKDVTVPHKFKILCGTWNVNQARPPDASLKCWLKGHGRLEQCDIVVLGLQEVEGPSSVAKGMVTIGKYSKSNSDKGSVAANWWANEFEMALSEEDGILDKRWKRVALRQMSGIIIYVFARQKLMKYLGNIGTAQVGTGVMGRGGNKGGVSITFSLYRRRVTVVSSHFAAHKDNVAKRRNDYISIVRNMAFAKEKDLIPVPSPPVRSATTPKSSFMEEDRYETLKSMDTETGETEVSSGLQQAELLIWLGDFNYRLETSYEAALDHIRQNKALSLLSVDQCRREMKEENVFVGLREGKIQFNPTYKFDKGPGGGYDSSEKKRVPAWTDRIFFRGSKEFVGIEEEEEEEEIEKPLNEEEPLIPFESSVSFVDRAAPAHDADAIVVACESYDACMDVFESDHKPVWCILDVSFPAFIQEKLRDVSFNLLSKDSTEVVPKIGLNLNAKFLDFVGDGDEAVEIQNRSETTVKVRIFTEETENANQHLPGWLNVVPRTFLIVANAAENIRVTVSQQGAGRRLQSQKKLYRKLIVRAEAVQADSKTLSRDYELGVLLRAT